jgi:glutathione S-transferase
MLATMPVLYSAIACNYCHRVRAVLHAKGIHAEVVEIDLVRRPGWYRKKASRGAVPLYESDGREIHGSAVINEFLDEQAPEPPLLPTDAGERAEARMWIAWADVAPAPHYEALLMNVHPEQRDEFAKQMAKTFEALESRLTARGYREGFWGGNGFGLVDATYSAVFERLPLLEEFQGFTLAPELRRVSAWAEALRASPYVRESAPDPKALRETIADYHTVLARASAASARS